MLSCSIGLTAYNEEANIGQLLERLLNQTVSHVTMEIDIVEILVVASGCTDRTEEIVTAWSQKAPKVKLLVQPEREGKASAINLFLKEADRLSQVLLLMSADLLPNLNTVEKLLLPFLLEDEVGLTAGRPVPVNDRQTFTGFMAHLLWDLHHYMNLSGRFKGGEMIAFRPIFARIPNHTAVDEASIEPLVRGQGYQALYVPDAIVYNKGPETVADFLKQRRRIYAGHLELEQALGYAVSTMGGVTILKLFLAHLDLRPKQFVWSWRVAFLELYGRFLGRLDFANKRNHTVWDIAQSTKRLNG